MMLLYLGASLAAGQTPKSKDIDGWGKVRWNMTITQAKAAYGSQVEDSDTPPNADDFYTRRLMIKNFDLGGIPVKVSICTRPNSDRIKSVLLEMPDGVERDARSSAYTTLLNSLTAKYGSPTRRDDKESKEPGKEYLDTRTKAANWMLRSTVINLVWIESKYLGILSLQYEAPDKKVIDAL